MAVLTKSLQELTAEDLMTREVVLLPEAMALRDAARLLIQHHVGGAPVVDAQGRCVGVLSAIDFVRLVERCPDATRPDVPPLPITCAFQRKHRLDDGREVALCALPPGVCPMQTKQTDAPGHEIVVCSQPHCVLVDWQVVELEKLPDDEVCSFMTADPVTVAPDTPIRKLARMMIDAHIHRIIVIDEERKPIGVVSSTDVLAAVAHAGGEP